MTRRWHVRAEQAQLVYDSLGVDARARLEARSWGREEREGASEERRRCPPPGCPPQADPYLLLSLLPGTAFPAVDRLALSQLGARLDSPRRAAAAIEACLRQSSSDGAERRIPWRGRGAPPQE